MNNFTHYHQQAEPKHCKFEVEEIYVFTKTWKLAIAASTANLKMDNGVTLERISPKKLYLKVVKLGS